MAEEIDNSYGATSTSHSLELSGEQRVRSVSSFYAENGETQENTGGCVLSGTGKDQQSKKPQKHTRVSFSTDHPSTRVQGTASPITTRHVSFVGDVGQTQTDGACSVYESRGESDSLSDSLTRVRTITNTSVVYQTHSEAEECLESDVAMLCSQRSLQNSTRRRRRFSSRRGVLVSDSFVNECVCCCTIL